MLNPLEPSALAAQSKLFALLDAPGQQRLLAVGQREDVDAGDIVVREGELGQTFYLVLDGVLAVRIAQRGASREVAVLQAGAFFGEMGALVGEDRSATVVAKTESRLLCFDAASVQAVLKDYPKVRESVMKLALQRSEDNLQQMLVDDDVVSDASAEARAVEGPTTEGPTAEGGATRASLARDDDEDVLPYNA